MSALAERNHVRPINTRPQYHYFYGSLDETAEDSESALDSPAANDQDSLVGESLVPTDNEQEDEMPYGNAQDYQQLLVSNGGKHLLPIKELVTSINSEQSKPWYRDIDFERKCGGNPLLHVCFLVGGLSITLFIAAVLMFPERNSSTAIPPPASELKFRMPFPRVNRADYNDPVENFMNTNLFHRDLLYQGQRAPHRVFNFPFPTGAFWTNLVMAPTADRGISYPIAVYPYAYAWNDDFLQVSYPANHRKEDPKAIHDYFFPDLTFSAVEGGNYRKITTFDALSVSLSFTTPTGGSWETYLVQGSPYITIRYDQTTPYIKAFTTFTNIMCPRDEDGNDNIVVGNTTGKRRLSYGVCYTADTDHDNKSSTKLHGVQFILQASEGSNWIIFASEPITLIFDTLSRTNIVSPAPFTGIIRIALIPKASLNRKEGFVDVSSSSGLKRLIYHARVFPTSGKVSWSFKSTGSDSLIVNAAQVLTGLASRSASVAVEHAFETAVTNDQPADVPIKTSRTATLLFSYTVQTFAPAMSSTVDPPLLMLSLPHHADRLAPSGLLDASTFDLVFSCIKGPMTPVTGSTWSYDEPLYSLGFDNDSGATDSMNYGDATVRDKILKSLVQDIDLALPTMNENIYGFGKQSARLAQLAHISSKLLLARNVTVADVSMNKTSTIRNVDRTNEVLLNLYERSVKILTFSLEQLLAGNTTDRLVYDQNLGGMVTSDGLRDSGADFGNGRYNDHHFHYGYILYACAMLGKMNSDFVKEYGNRIDTLFYDVAHNSNFNADSADGVFFPGARHKSWFDGHSFASGMFPFANGKSQESSSEAVNCYYGAYLWSLVRHGAVDNPDSDLTSQTDFVRLLLATEIRGTKYYWHMQPPLKENGTTSQKSLHSVYTPTFTRNYMVGNLGMLDVICSTWFGTQDLYVHMINFMPVTSITGELFNLEYASEEYTRILEPLGEVEMAWRGYVVSDKAISDANEAWIKANELFSPQLDSALSKSQVLYWISTRKGFNMTQISQRIPPSHYGSDGTSNGNGEPHDVLHELAECSAHSLCFSQGLTGFCCPTSEGVFLECCSSR